MHKTECFLSFFHTNNGNGQWKIDFDFRFYISGVRDEMGWFCIEIDCLVEKGAVE